jgi:hypothetical protein
MSAALKGQPRPEWVRAKLRKPKPPRTVEHCRNLSIGGKGKKMPPMTQATKDKIRAAMIGRTFSDETLRRMSDGQKRRFHGKV